MLLLIALWAAVPALASRSVTDMLVFTALYSIAGLGVSFLLGQCGIVSLAQSVFYGVGAYSTAYCCVQLGWPASVGLLAGIGVSAVVAVAVGWPILRLSGYFLALATLALAIIGHVLFLEWDWLTGGTLGIGGIPRLSMLGYELNSPQRFYYLAWPLAAALLWFHANLLRSRNGLAMRAMRDAPAAAAVLGINVRTLKVRIFVLSAVLGGAKTIIGTVFGALFITLVPNALSRFGDIHAVLFAACLVAAVMFLPDGFGGALARLTARLRSTGSPG